jgi:HPt (histidine-containing phosphotransfer) domain-containing protein
MDASIVTLDSDALAELEQDLGEVFARFVSDFLDAMPTALDAVDAALSVGDDAAAAAHAHRMKGTAGYLGAAALAAGLGDLQRAAEQGEHARAHDFAERVRELYGEVAPALCSRAARG